MAACYPSVTWTGPAVLATGPVPLGVPMIEDMAEGLVQGATDLLVERTRNLMDLLASAGGGALGKVPEPVPAAVRQMVGALVQVTDQMPPVTAELGVIIEQLHAQRKSVQALQAQLAVMDRQLELLERTLAPVEAWQKSWESVRASLRQSLDLSE